MVDIRKKTNQKIYLGIVGNPVSHSLSPAMHNELLKKYKIDGAYLPFEVEKGNFPDAIRGMKALKFRGVNITLPFKEEALKICDWLDEEARSIGSVNTILFEDEKIKGFNTDAFGFEKSIEKKGYNLSSSSVAILGGGGTARTICFVCAKNNAGKITIFNRTKEKAEKIKSDIQSIFPSSNIAVEEFGKINFDEFDIIVNATSLGWKGENLFEVIGCTPKPNKEKTKKLFYDTVYIQTPFIKIASKMGYDTEDGKWMLVLQGAKSFQIWLGLYPEEKLMFKTIKEELAKNRKGKKKEK
jgi:shikimate dehydrogenase